jgi:hypothetical protein
LSDVRTQLQDELAPAAPARGLRLLEVNGQPRHVWAAHFKMRCGPLVEGQG